jgi:hypothetical protein
MTLGRRRPRRTLPGLLIGMAVTATAALLTPLIPAAGASPGWTTGAGAGIEADTDVYIRDYVGDAGIEPHSNSVWTSPDIKVCPTMVECAVSQNPEVGSMNYIFVKLNNPGPYGSGADVGTLDVYRSTPGGGTGWISDWTSIGGVLGLSVAASGVTTAVIPWPNVPGPGHFCLLARWESADDPMSFPEGPNTVLNTQRNNNLAWRNVDSVDLLIGGESQERPYAIGNPGQQTVATDLAFTDPRNTFLAGGGRLVVDLGQDIARRWREGGGRATGVKVLGETTLEITDLRQARLFGIRLDPRSRPAMKLFFSARTTARQGTYLVRVNQFAPLDAGVPANAVPAPTSAVPAPTMSDVGGVEYQITIK